jgi:acyl carrier protein
VTTDEFAALVSAETGLQITEDDLTLPFDALAQWDSMYLITVATAVEARTGRSMPVADALDCTSLDQLRSLIGR